MNALMVVLLLFAAAVAEAGVTPSCPGRVIVTEGVLTAWTADWFVYAPAGTPATVIGQASPNPAAPSVLIRFDWILSGGAKTARDLRPLGDEWVLDAIVRRDLLRAAPCATQPVR